MFPSQVIVGDDEPFVVLRTDYVHQSSQDEQCILAIFGPSGDLLRRYRLPDLFTGEEIERLPHSVSGLRWSEAIHKGEEDGVLEFQTPIPRPIPAGAVRLQEPVRAKFRLKLRDGVVERVPLGASGS